MNSGRRGARLLLDVVGVVGRIGVVGVVVGVLAGVVAVVGKLTTTKRKMSAAGFVLEKTSGKI